MPISSLDVPIRAMSLRRSTARRAGLSEHLGSLGLRFSFFDAVDGRAMSEEEVAAMRPAPLSPYGTPIKRTEIGLAATLRALCGEIAEGDEEFVCILEDDARLDPRVLRFFSPAVLAGLPRFDLLRFGHDGVRLRSGYVRIAREDGIDILAPVRHGNCVHGQIVSRAGAAAIAKGLVPLSGAIDTHLFDFPRLPLRILETHPPLARQAGYDSNIRTPDDPPALVPHMKREIRLARRRAKQYFRTSWGTWAYVRARVAGQAQKLRPRRDPAPPAGFAGTPIPGDADGA
jgi:glycosyl transferase family 25